MVWTWYLTACDWKFHLPFWITSIKFYSCMWQASRVTKKKQPEFSMQISETTVGLLLFFPLVRISRDQMSWIIFSSLVDSFPGGSKIKHGRECRKSFGHTLKSSEIHGSQECRHEGPLRGPSWFPCYRSPYMNLLCLESHFLGGQAAAGWELCLATSLEFSDEK